jgi:hypothetical protein
MMWVLELGYESAEKLLVSKRRVVITALLQLWNYAFRDRRCMSLPSPIINKGNSAKLI